MSSRLSITLGFRSVAQPFRDAGTPRAISIDFSGTRESFLHHAAGNYTLNESFKHKCGSLAYLG